MVDMRTIFSVRDWLESLRDFSNYSALNELANAALDAGQQIIANPSNVYRALKLTISVRYGSAGNTVSLTSASTTPGPGIPLSLFPSAWTLTFIQGGLPIGTELVAVGQNLWHSRLRSETGLSQTVTQNTTCPRPPCEPIDP